MPNALIELPQFFNGRNRSSLQWSLNETATHTHDNLLSLTDAAGNTHRFAYSKVGQLLKETRPLGGAIEYRYNAAGYLTQRTDAANNTRTYRYDAVGRLIEEEHTLPDNTRDQLSQYAYNKDGQLTGYEQTDGSNQLISSATYDLDEQGRTKTGTTTYGKIGFFVISCGFGLFKQMTYRAANQVNHGDEIGLVPVAACP